MTDNFEWDQETAFSSKKDWRKVRKAYAKKDRSKFKQSNIDQSRKQKKALVKGEKSGRVTSLISKEIFVDCDGEEFRCILRGSLKKERTGVKNLVVVGDFVEFDITNPHEGVVVSIHPRKSFLLRADNHTQIQKHMIAANIDQIFITVSIGAPTLKPHIIDRYLIATHEGNMKPIILINKIDLLEESPEEKEIFDAIMSYYPENIAQVLPISCETGEGIEELMELMKNKSSVFSGQSGVGKSSLINTVLGTDLAVSDTVIRTKKGSHTTTAASLIRLENGGFCIDTPGIKSFGVWNIRPEEVKDYFLDFVRLQSSCKFPNCSHIHEPECAVTEAIKNEELPLIRYSSYIALIESLRTRHLGR